MGCAYSTDGRAIFRKMNDNGTLVNSKKMFKVINVDESGNEISLGHIEITDTELILHQKGRNPIVWSLRSIRRYGFDSQLFSFECGRRCATGPGVYGFKCTQAEQLFNILQESVQKCSNSNCDSLPSTQELNENLNHTATGIVPLSCNPTLSNNLNLVQRQQENPRFAHDEDVRTEPSSPTALIVPSIPNVNMAEPSLNACAASPIRQCMPTNFKCSTNTRDYVNSPSYMNTGSIANEFVFRTNENSANVSPEKSPIRTSFGIRTDEIQPYVNVQLSTNGLPIPKVLANDEQDFTINYTVLDLDKPTLPSEDNHCNGTVVSTLPVTPIAKNFKKDASNSSPPQTPGHHQTGDQFKAVAPQSIPYAAIDFDKTVALSNSAAIHRKEILHHG